MFKLAHELSLLIMDTRKCNESLGESEIQYLETEIKKLIDTFSLMSATGNPRHYPDHLKSMIVNLERIDNKMENIDCCTKPQIKESVSRLRVKFQEYLKFRKLKSLMIAS